MWLSAHSEQKLSLSSVSTGVLKPAVYVARLATTHLYFSPMTVLHSPAVNYLPAIQSSVNRWSYYT